MPLPQPAPRSFLFVPAHQPDRLVKAIGCGAESLVLDLEDQVPPEHRPAARQALVQWPGTRGTGVSVWVRVNPIDTPDFALDLEAVAQARPAGVVLPRCEGAADVLRLHDALSVLEARHGLPAGRFEVGAIITDTARAMQLAHSFTGPLPRLVAISWGAAVLARSLGIASLRDEAGRLLPLAQRARDSALLAAHACGVLAVDAGFLDYNDLAGLVDEVRAHGALGFAAKAAVHPLQVPLIHKNLRPDTADMLWAYQVLAEMQDASTETSP